MQLLKNLSHSHSGAVQVCQHGPSSSTSGRHRIALSPLTEENCQGRMFYTFQKQLPGLEEISKSVHVTIKQEFLDGNGKRILQSFCKCHLYDYIIIYHVSISS